MEEQDEGNENEEYYLKNPTPDGTLLEQLSVVVPKIGVRADRAASMMCGDVGEVKKASIVVLDHCGQIAVGEVEYFARCTSTVKHGWLHFVIVRQFVQVGKFEWKPSLGEPTVSPCESIQFVVPYVVAEGHNIIPFIPSDEIRRARRRAH